MWQCFLQDAWILSVLTERILNKHCQLISTVVLDQHKRQGTEATGRVQVIKVILCELKYTTLYGHLQINILIVSSFGIHFSLITMN